MSDPETLTVDVNGFATRVWRKGTGPKLGFLAGFGGLPRWVPFLDELAKSRTVIVPSLPGFPGGERGHSALDNHLDWVLATHLLLQKAGLDGADLAGSGPGGFGRRGFIGRRLNTAAQDSLFRHRGYRGKAGPRTPLWLALRRPSAKSLALDGSR